MFFLLFFVHMLVCVGVRGGKGRILGNLYQIYPKNVYKGLHVSIALFYLIIVYIMIHVSISLAIVVLGKIPSSIFFFLQSAIKGQIVFESHIIFSKLASCP